jgi:hypothetical protein
MSGCIQIERIRVWDILAVTRMVYANMIGVDVDFTELTRTPFRRALSYLFVPIYLLTAGEGFKARREGRLPAAAITTCAGSAASSLTSASPKRTADRV